MRSVSGPEQTVLESRVREVALKVEVQNSGGSYVDLSQYAPGASIEVDVDAPVHQATVQMVRASGATKLSPLLAATLDLSRGVKISASTVAPGGGANYKLIFQGYITRVDWQSDPLSFEATGSPGGRLAERWVEEERAYGSDAGVAIETVMASIVSDWTAESLDTPSSPGFLISPAYRQERSSVWDALAGLAALIGWTVRERINAGGTAYVARFEEPDRTPAGTMWTFGADDILGVHRMSLDRDPLRNSVRVSYTDAATGERAFVLAEDATGIAADGRLWMEIEQEAESPIDTEAEAQELADAALADLSEPPATFEFPVQFFWPIELDDFYAFTALTDIFPATQEWAVTGFTHEFPPDPGGMAVTRVRVRGKPQGYYRKWHETAQPPQPLPLEFKSLTYVMDGSGSGVATADVTQPVRSIWFYAKADQEPTREEILAYGVNVEVTQLPLVVRVGRGDVGELVHLGAIGSSGLVGDTASLTEVARASAPVQARPLNAAPQFQLLPVITGTTGIVQAILAADPDGTMNPFGAGDTEARVEFRRVDTGAVQIDHTPTNPTTGPTYQNASAYTGLGATPLRIEVTAYYWRTEDELASIFLGAVDLVENPLAEIDDGYADWHFSGKVRLRWKHDNQTTDLKYIARRSGPYPNNAATRALIIATGTDVDVATYGVPADSTIYFTTPDDLPNPGEAYYWAALAYDGATEGVVTVGSRVRDPGLRGTPFAFSGDTGAQGRWIDAQWGLDGELIAGTNTTLYAGYPYVGVGGIAGAMVQAIRLKVSLEDMPDDDWDSDPGVLLAPEAVVSGAGTAYESRSFVATFPDLLGAGLDGSAQVVVSGLKLSTFAPFYQFGAGVQFTNVLLANPNQRMYVRALPLGDPAGLMDPGPSITTVIYGFDTALSLPISFPDDQPERTTFGSPELVAAHSLSDMGLTELQHIRAIAQARVLDGTSGTANLRIRFLDVDGNLIGSNHEGPSVSGFDAADGRILLEVPALEIPEDTDIIAVYLITSHGAGSVAFGNCQFFTRMQPSPAAAAAVAPAAATHEQAALSAATAVALPAEDAARHGAAADETGATVMAVPVRDRTNTVTLIDEEGRLTDDAPFGTGSLARESVQRANRDISATQAAIGYGGVPVPPIGGQYIPGYTGQGDSSKTDNNWPESRRAQWQKILFAEEIAFSEIAFETGPDTNDPGTVTARIVIATVSADGLEPDEIIYESGSITWDVSTVLEVTGLSFEPEPGVAYMVGVVIRSTTPDGSNFPTTKRWDDPADSVRLFPIASAGGDFSDSACLITENEPLVSYAASGSLPLPWTGAVLLYSGESACFWMLRSG